MRFRPVTIAIAIFIAGCDSKSPESNPVSTTPAVSTSTTVATSTATTDPPAPSGPVGIGKLVTVGHIRVMIKSARIGKVPLKQSDGSIEYSPDLRLMIALRIENIHEKLMSRYSTWVPDHDGQKSFARLKDDGGNELKRVTFGFGNNVKDRTVLDDITAGKVISDLLVFEVPSPKATALDLELPGGNCGVKGEFRFHIDVKSISR